MHQRRGAIPKRVEANRLKPNPVMFVPSFTRAMLGAALVLLVQTLPVHSEIIYDNSASGGELIYYTLNEYGDEVSLGGTSRTLTSILFEYYGDFSEANASGKTARVRLYL